MTDVMQDGVFFFDRMAPCERPLGDGKHVPPKLENITKDAKRAEIPKCCREV